MGINVQDVQTKSRVFAEILRAYKNTLKWDNWKEAHFTFEKPPDGWGPSVDQTKEVEVELVLKDKQVDKDWVVWLKTKSPAASQRRQMLAR